MLVSGRFLDGESNNPTCRKPDSESRHALQAVLETEGVFSSHWGRNHECALQVDGIACKVRFRL